MAAARAARTAASNASHPARRPSPRPTPCAPRPAPPATPVSEVVIDLATYAAAAHGRNTLAMTATTPMTANPCPEPPRRPRLRPGLPDQPLPAAAHPPRELKLHHAAEQLPAVLDAATTEGLSLTAALERLLALEVDATEARRLAGRLRFASLPSPATMEGFDFDAAAGVDPALINELATCRYLETATNVLLIGPPGTGKTHLAVGLAARPPRPATAPTSPPPPTWPPAVTAPRSKAAGPPPCGSSPAPPCWSSTSSATCPYPPKPPPPCSRSSPSATARPPSS